MTRTILCVVALLSLSPGVAAGVKIAWFTNLYASEARQGYPSPRNKLVTTGFWLTAHIFATAAAADLDVDLDVYYADGNAGRMLKQAEQCMRDPQTRPDGIMFHNWLGTGERILRLAERYGVDAMVFNAGFPPDHPVGRPREKLRHWIGQMYPDDEHAGYLLATTLFAAGKNLRRPDRTIRMIALEGNRTSQASALRVRGLKRALAEHPEVELEQYFHSKWKRNLGKNAFLLGIGRYPGLSVFWAASESMAMGVLDGAAERGWVPNRDFVVGGVDLLPNNFSRLLSKDLYASIGGHYVEGAWALIALHDYLHGFDFADNQSVTLKTQMISLTADEVAGFGDLRRKLLPENIAAVDFRRYSKVYNPSIERYEFPTKSLLKQIHSSP